MKVLITGGLGNLGLWLTEYFLKQGYLVTVLGRTKKPLVSHINYRFINADITDQRSLENNINEYYDFCIHAASYNEYFEPEYGERALLINSLGTDNLCSALLNYGVGKLVYLSTFHVYGVQNGYVSEDNPTSPINDYALTHLFAEQYIQKKAKTHGLSYCIFRLTNSYGCPKDINSDKWYLVLNDLCREAYIHNKIKLNGNGNALRDFIWMGDVAKILEASLIEKGCSNTIFNLSSSKTYKIIDIAKVTKRAFFDLYKKDIEIEINHMDLTTYSSLTVSNEKLLNEIDFSVEDRLFDEAKDILRMLEMNSNEN